MAKKKKSQIPYSSRAPICHAYDSVLTGVARLAAFASCPLLVKWGEADQRLQDLAIDDLISLAIHLRRLLELTGRKKHAAKVVIPATYQGQPQQVPITRAINGLIHHTGLSIARRKADMLPPPSKDKSDSWLEWHQAFSVGMRPIAWLTSDQIEFLAFRVEVFVTAIATEVLPPLVSYCDDEGLYLESMDPD